MPQSFVSLHVHVVFSTKNRKAQITEDLASRLYEYIGGIIRGEGGCLVAAGGMPDHVHLLVSFGKELSTAKAVRLIKSNSSKWIHETFPKRHDFRWQAGYGAFGVSNSNVEAVTRYIRDQAAHHQRRSFQEEFRELLNRHGIEFDERYLWV